MNLNLLIISGFAKYPAKTTYYFNLIESDMGLFHYSYVEVTIVLATRNSFMYNRQCYGVTL